MRHVTELDFVSKSKCRIVLDGSEAFTVYKRECNRFGIEKGSVITDEQYLELINFLKKRALKYAVYILEASDRTEAQIRDKLNSAGYPGEAVCYAIEKLCGYHYIDDRRYAENFVQKNCGNMSLRDIECKLYGKKVPGEVIKEVLDAYKSDNHNADEEAFLHLFNKRSIDPTALDYKEKQRTAAFFLRRGFSYELIKKYLDTEEI